MAQYDYEIEDVMKHFSGENSEEMLKYMEEIVFKESRYIFTTRKSNQQYGYCTYCGEKYDTDGIRHNNKAICPECGSTCTVKASGYGRKSMIDERYFVWYDKSAINHEAIVARGIYAVRDWSGNYHNIETKMVNAALYVFEPGSAMAIRRSVGYPHWRSEENIFWTSWWERCRKIYSEDNNGHLNNIPSYCSKLSIRRAAQDTPFQYSCWENYTSTSEDLIEFFGLYSKWPCIEYLTKLGFDNLVRNRIYGHKTYSAVNWRGKDLFSVLKITKDDLQEIKDNALVVSFLGLHIFQQGKKDGSNFSITEADELATIYGGHFEELEKLLEYGKIRKTTRYLNKQYKSDNEHFYSEKDALTDWKDYISDCKELDMDLDDEKVLFPRNLYRAHQNTIKQIKIKKDEKLRELFQKRYNELKKYIFKYKSLMIRPVKTQKELINEGKKLSHCVGTYGKRHAKGDTNIFFIRRVSKPDEPYYTVEIRRNEVIQVRGKNNIAPDDEVSKFIKIFKSEKLSVKENKIPA